MPLDHAAPRGLTLGSVTSSHVARLDAALDAERLGATEAAAQEMRELASLCPGWDEPHVRLAEAARRRGDLAAAAAAYECALDRAPSRVDALVGLAVLLIARGEAARAQMLLLRACALAPDRAEAWDALGLALMATGEAGEAETAFARAQTLLPADLGVALRRAEAAVAAGRGEAELARLEVATTIDPLDVVQLTCRGVLLDRLGRTVEAADVLEAAATLAPDAPGPATELSNVLIHLPDIRRAEAAMRRAVALSPDRPLLRNNLAVVLMRLHRHVEARALLERALDEQGPEPGLLANLANALVALGLQDAAVAAGRAATALAPGSHLAWRATANALAYAPDSDGAALLAAQRAAAACLPLVARHDFTHLDFTHHDFDHHDFDHHDFDRARLSDRRLRVGLLSATLKTHPVGWLTVAGFEQLDPAAFAIVCIGPEEAGDPIARRFRAIAAEWHDPRHASPAALAQAIRDIGIDVLIDLGGHGDRGMMSACAWRAAPVQVKWVGMQNHSTGMPAMDWFVTDRWETPPSLEHLYSERLMRMPDGYVCYSPPAYAPDVAPSPAGARGHVTFGCFNNLAKITPAVLAAWARILAAIPEARLVLKTHQFDEAEVRARLRHDFAQAGGDVARLELRGASPHRALLAEYGEIDIVLDPFPYTGGLTTCEALWMGVPTITLAGDSFAGRHATSHLGNVGLADWVCGDVEQYVAMAIARASDTAALARLRAGMRARVAGSPLCDAPRFGRHLGAALRAAWRDWCDSLPVGPGR